MLQSMTKELAQLLQTIDSNLNLASSHKTNASVAKTAAVAAYLLTNNSTNKTTRTLGQLGAAGGLIYGSGESNKANNLKQQNLSLVQTGVKLVTEKASQPYQMETVRSAKEAFLVKALEISRHLDVYVLEHLSQVSRMHTLTNTNRSRLLNLQNEYVFAMKLNLNRFFQSVDHSVDGSGSLHAYRVAISNLDMQKLKKETTVMTACILGTGMVGSVLLFSENSNNVNAGVVVLITSIALYIIHVFYPVTTETKKLRLAVNSFKDGLKRTTQITSLHFS